jgi:hypothetical protein
VGYTGLALPISSSFTATTTWQRFTATGTVASTATEIALELRYTATGTTAGAADYLEVTGVQLEVGSVATPFRRSGGTIQGELAACQRYYIRYTGVDYGSICWSQAENTTQVYGFVVNPVQMRVVPTAAEFSSLRLNYAGVGGFTITSIALDNSTNLVTNIRFITTGLTAQRTYAVLLLGGSGYLGLSAEL